MFKIVKQLQAFCNKNQNYKYINNIITVIQQYIINIINNKLVLKHIKFKFVSAESTNLYLLK